MHLRWQVVAALTMLLPACSDNLHGDPPAPTGGLTITFATTGDLPDPDGYAFSIDGATDVAIGVNGSSTQAGFITGDHLIAVSGLASNCILAGDNPRTATVVEDDTITVAFEVTCQTPPCGIQSAVLGTVRPSGPFLFAPDRQKLAAGCARRSPESVRL